MFFQVVKDSLKKELSEEEIGRFLIKEAQAGNVATLKFLVN